MDIDEAPILAEYLPAGQGIQLVAPVVIPKVPGGQGKQAARDVEPIELE